MQDLDFPGTSLIGRINIIGLRIRKNLHFYLYRNKLFIWNLTDRKVVRKMAQLRPLYDLSVVLAGEVMEEGGVLPAQEGQPLLVTHVAQVLGRATNNTIETGKRKERTKSNFRVLCRSQFGCALLRKEGFFLHSSQHISNYLCKPSFC